MKHLCGRRHHFKLKEWSLKLFPTSYPVTQKEIDLLDDSCYEETEDNDMETMDNKVGKSDSRNQFLNRRSMEIIHPEME